LVPGSGLGSPGFDEQKAINEVIAALKGTSTTVSGADDGQLAEKTAALAKADGIIAELNKRIGILEASEIATKAELEEYKQVVEEFLQACGELNGLLRDKTTEGEEKDKYIKSLLESIQILMGKLDDLDKLLEGTQDFSDEQKGQIKQLQGEIVQKAQEIVDKDTTIDRLRGDIARLEAELAALKGTPPISVEELIEALRGLEGTGTVPGTVSGAVPTIDEIIEDDHE
jgi:chromosome segregation ATPase